MKRIFQAVRSFSSQADMLLLMLCCAAALMGLLVIASATDYAGSERYAGVQAFAILVGLFLYIVFSLVDIDIIAEKWEILLIFNILFIGCLYFLGVEGDTGNKSWLRFSFVPIGVQPAEVCKITFIILMAKHMTRRRETLSSFISVFQYLAHTLFMVALIVWSSSDAGMAIVYVAIFIIMSLAAGVKTGWFAAGTLAAVVAAPFVWLNLMREDQKLRILVIFDSSIDPDALDERWQMALSETMLGAGQLFGQGYGNGSITQTGQLPAQHTDFVFSVVGEELGFLGCSVVLILLALIIIRIFYIGLRSNNYMHRLICCGIAGMLMFQTFVNVGMCLGLVPIIGLTLPFFSYGGSSIITMFAAMGIVSGIKMRPAPDVAVRYIRPPITV